MNLLSESLERANEQAQSQLLSERTPAGHWVGELSASALSTATAISAFSFYLQEINHANVSASLNLEQIRTQVRGGIAWLMANQNGDGGWGDTPKSYSNISTTMLVVAAMHAAERADEFAPAIGRAESYIASKGGIEGVRARYGRDKTFAVPILANCAMAGIVPWKEVAALPFEAAVVPQRYYNWLQLPVVSYAIPALVAIGQAKFHFDPPWDPVRRTIRRLCIKPGLRVLENIQPASGGYLEAIPLTSFVSMALIRCGRSEHSVVQKGVQFLLDSYRPSSDDEPNEQGTWPIDTNLATWVTSLSINALANQPNSFRALLENDSSTWQSCVDWLLSCQNRDKHPFTGSEPGGWGWTDLSGAVPDADDTPGAMLALRAIVDANPTWLIDKRRVTLEAAAIAGAEWLLDLQNRDGGWPTFCRGWGKLPFDRSGSDITAHAIRGLLAWRQVCAMQQRERIDRAIAKGFRYLKKQQRADGSWLPLWFGNQDQPDDENPFYGTAKVLMAYRAARLENTQPAIAGASWLLKNQNKDGGWGGCQNGTSSVEETALCTEALFAVDDGAGSQARVGALAGAAWLQAAVASDDVRVSSPIGFYFAKLWYFEKLYPTIFAAGALNRAVFVESGCSADDV